MNTGDPNHHGGTANAAATTTGPRAKCDQVIFEALAKATEIIVASRGGGIANQAPNSPTPSSSRFNLTLPENPALRNILQRWRRALHLPIRLDVYYQHEDGRRELLERWCLGYVMGDAFWRDQHNAALFQTAATGVTKNSNPHDHIVQLRHVCKKIVIWLRTLYCYARLLPSTAFHNAKMHTTLQGAPGTSTTTPTLGFSLYAVSSEETDDVTQLKEQGFLRQGQPAAAVTTPYGDLSWQVLYAKSDTVERLLPRVSQVPRNLLSSRTPSATQAIPIAGASHQQRQQHYAHDVATEQFPPTSNHMGGVPQTAPAHMNQYLSSKQGEAESDGHQRYPRGTQNQTGGLQQNTYNPSYFTTGRPLDEHQNQQSTNDNMPRHGLLQRRHTSIGQESEVPLNDSNNRPPSLPSKGEQPTRVLSGLSLALMNSEGNDNHHQNNQQNPDGTNTPIAQQHDASEGATSAAEKRRAALHQMPPHLQHQQQSTTTSSREYGYAYNNHIPRQSKSPLHQPLSATPPDTRPASPGLLGTTPPLGVLYLGNNAATAAVNTTGSSTTPPHLGSLIPPRKNSATMTPPFAPRPLGFVQENALKQQQPSQLSMLPPTAEGYSGFDQQQKPLQSSPQHDVDLPPLTSLDMLHHSPFHHGNSHMGGTTSGISMLSSLASGGGGPLLGSEAASLFYNHHSSLHGASDLRKSSSVFFEQQIQHSAQPEEYEEMPFAVEESSAAQSLLPDNNATASFLASSAAVASFAQKCSVHQRLELFDKQQESMIQTGPVLGAPQETNTVTNNEMDQLADQLADFRSFGASLRMSATTTGS